MAEERDPGAAQGAGVAPKVLSHAKHLCTKVHAIKELARRVSSMAIPLAHGKYRRSPLRMDFHYRPHVEHLHVVGGLPFFQRGHRQRRRAIPWHEYSRYEHLRPKARPPWMPAWMWREIGAHTQHDPRQVERMLDDYSAGGGSAQQLPQQSVVMSHGKGMDVRYHEIGDAQHQTHGEHVDFPITHAVNAQAEMWDEYEYEEERDEDAALEAWLDAMYPLLQRQADDAQSALDAMRRIALV